MLFALSAPALAAPVTIPPGVAPGQPYHLIFVTSERYGMTSTPTFPPPIGAINGLAGADWYVTLAAFSGGLPDASSQNLQSTWNGLDLVYTAILSTSTVDARDRFTVSGPIYNTQGIRVADDGADLWDGSLDAPIAYNEYGNAVVTGLDVWTGSTGFGEFSGNAAHDWTDNSSVAEYGNLTRTNATWARDSFQSASNTARLYGISPALVYYDPADTDHDGDVDTADLTVMFQNFTGDVGAAGMKDMTTGDTDLDGDVDTADITTGLQNFTGAQASLAAPAHVTVPEPSTLALACIGGLLYAWAHRRRTTARPDHCFAK